MGCTTPLPLPDPAVRNTGGIWQLLFPAACLGSAMYLQCLGRVSPFRSASWNCKRRGNDVFGAPEMAGEGWRLRQGSPAGATSHSLTQDWCAGTRWSNSCMEPRCTTCKRGDLSLHWLWALAGLVKAPRLHSNLLRFPPMKRKVYFKFLRFALTHS